MNNQFEKHILDNKIDTYTKEKGSLINKFLSHQERLDRLNNSYLFSYISMITFTSILLLITGKMFYINALNFSIFGVVFILVFLIALLAVGKQLLESIKELKILINTLKVKIHNDTTSINSLDVNKLEDGLVYLYHQAIEKSANNKSNKSIHRQLKNDLEKFIFHSNKSNISRFIQLWSDYNYKLSQSDDQIYS